MKTLKIVYIFALLPIFLLTSCVSNAQKTVEFTIKGAALVEAIVEKLIEVNTELFSGILSESDCEALADLLGKMTAGLEEKLSPKGPRD